MLKPAQVRAAAERLEDRLGLDALWLYGPVLHGKAGKRADLSLAALFRRPPQGMEVLEATLDLAALLRRNIDLVDLERLPPARALAVLRNGQLLVDRNPSRRQELLLRTEALA
jgi:predicted nucleotidyltransferase